MKKIFYLFALFIFTLRVDATEIIIKTGIDINGDSKIEDNIEDINKKYNSRNTIHIGAEMYQRYIYLLYLGGGIEFQNKLKIENREFVTIIPVYVAGKIKFIKSGVKLYLGSKIGAAVPFFENKNSAEYSVDGVFWGINAGMEFENNMIFEVFYEESNYGIRNSKSEIKFVTPKAGVNIGYRFDLK